MITSDELAAMMLLGLVLWAIGAVQRRIWPDDDETELLRGPQTSAEKASRP